MVVANAPSSRERSIVGPSPGEDRQRLLGSSAKWPFPGRWFILHGVAAMAWASFVSDGPDLWMAGFRDADDYSQDLVAEDRR